MRLVDVWRVQHPAQHDYTFYSAPHNSYSIIDYVLISQSLLPAVVNSTIGTLTVSDHAPVSLDLQLSKPANRPWTWKLNESLLQEGQLRNKLSSELIRIFNKNDSEEISPLILWETHKCVMRGILIKKATEIS